MVTTGERDVARLDRMMDRLGRTAGRVGSFIGTAIGTGVGAAGAGIAAFGAGIIKTSMDFERFQVILEGTEGSADKAKQAMSWAKKFAETTPYEIGQVMDAFVALRAYGVEPTGGVLQSLGNLAAGTGKDLMQVVEALADAQMGEFERLKEFQIKAKQSGDNVALTYNRNGKEITKTVKKNALEIQRAITSIADERFGNMMDRQSRTLGGILGNIKDKLTNFQLDVGAAGFFDLVKGRLQQLLDRINVLAANGTLKRWAQETSRFLVDLANKLMAIDWNRVWNALKGIGSALALIGSFFAAVQSTFGIFNVVIALVIGKIALSLYGLATALGLVSIAGAPIWAIVAIVGILAFGAVKLWQNWGTISDKFATMWTAIKKTFAAAGPAIWASLPVWLRGIFSGASFAIKLVGNLFSGGAPAPGAPAGRPAAPGSGGALLRGGRPAPAFVPRRPAWAAPGRLGSAAPVGADRRGPGARSPRTAAFGPAMRQQPLVLRQSSESRVAIDLNVKTDRGTTAKPTRMASNGATSVSVNRGALPLGG
jgi:hypothetical protein